MTGTDLAEVWREGRLRLYSELSSKDTPNEVPARMSKTYSRLGESEREQIIPLLREWLLSDEPADRFDACVIIGDNAVADLVPELRMLQDRLQNSDDVSAPYEWKAVNRTLGRVLAGERRTWT